MGSRLAAAEAAGRGTGEGGSRVGRGRAGRWSVANGAPALLTAYRCDSTAGRDGRYLDIRWATPAAARADPHVFAEPPQPRLRDRGRVAHLRQAADASAPSRVRG